MTERANGLVVSLDKDYREDDVEYIVNAIKMIKGVQDVSLNVVDYKDDLNRTRIRFELKNKLYNAIEKAFEFDTK